MGPSLHPDIEPLALLLGTWSGRGRGEYLAIEPPGYEETVTFAQLGKAFLFYQQRTWRARDRGGVAQRQVAASFDRGRERNRIQLPLAHLEDPGHPLPIGGRAGRPGRDPHVGRGRSERDSQLVVAGATADLGHPLEALGQTGDVTQLAP